MRALAQHGSEQTADEIPPDLGLGKWAEERLREAIQVNRFIYSGQEVEALRRDERIGKLKVWEDLFDVLTATRRKNLLSAMKRQRLKVDDLLEYLGDAKGIRGETMNRHRKKYRKFAGLSRKRAPKRKSPPP
jgi:hypothetical protein